METILRNIARGDGTAVSECLRTYGGLVWSLARRYSAGPEDAEDAVQEIFTDIWRSAPRFDPTIASEATFIAMIARRRLIDRRRKAGRSKPAGALESDEPASTDAPDAAPSISDEADRAASAMRDLSDDQRRVLELSIHRGMSHERIAHTTGMPLGTVKTHARRGLIRLRHLIEETSSGVTS